MREARFSDCEAVSSLKVRLGLGMDSSHNWQRLWEHNPALAQRPDGWSMGWILEAEEKVVGYLGSIPLLYCYGEKVLVAASTCGLSVEPPYRGISTKLVAAFFRQRHVDLFLDTTASDAAGKLFCAFKANRLPQRDYDRALLWILDPKDFAEACFRRIGLSRSVLVAVGGVVGGVVLRTDVTVRRRWPSRCAKRLQLRELEPTRIGDEFDWFWSRKTKERPRLFACRTSAVLRWHLCVPSDGHTNAVLQCFESGQMCGYATVTSRVVAGTGLLRSTIIDLVAQNDDIMVIECLLAGAYEYAKAHQSDLLEVFGFPACIRDVCSKASPYSRKLAAFPFYYRAPNEALHRSLSDEKSWYACPFDGDTSLWP